MLCKSAIKYVLLVELLQGKWIKNSIMGSNAGIFLPIESLFNNNKYIQIWPLTNQEFKAWLLDI